MGGRLDVRIVEARNLPDMEMIGSSDPYVKVELENQVHKTEVCENTENPKWDQVFKFLIADPDSTQLEMTLWNSNTFSDDFMGKYNISVSGLTKGVVSDKWCLLQNCKTNAEIRVRLLALDFGADPSPEEQEQQMPAQPPMPQQVQQQYNQQPQQNMYNQQQPQMQYQQQQPGMMQQQPGMMQQNQYQQQQPPQMQMQQQSPPQMQMQQPGMMMGGQQGGTVRIADFQQVQLNGTLVKATYGPEGTENDITQQLKNFQAQGRTVLDGGLHTHVGDPAPGTAKQGKLCFFERPNQEFADFQQVAFQGPVLCASYGAVGQFNDMTQQVRNLQAQGRNVIDGGIHTAIGDPAPGAAKKLLIWYS